MREPADPVESSAPSAADPLAGLPPPLADLAWMCLATAEPARAADLFRRRLETVAEAPWTFPGVLASAEAIAAALDEPAFSETFLQAAPALFEAEVATFDPRSDGLAAWPGDVEPVALDAAVLLAEDARLYLKLARRHAALLGQIEFARSTLNDVEDWLARALWDDDELAFLRRLSGQEEGLLDDTFRPFWALRWQSATPDMLDAVLSARPAKASDAAAAASVPMRLLLAAQLLPTRFRRTCGELLALPVPEGGDAAVYEEIRRILLEKLPAAARGLRPLTARKATPWVALAAGGLALAVAVAAGLRGKAAGEPLGAERRAGQLCADGNFAAAARLYQEALRDAQGVSDRQRLQYRQANCLLHSGDVAGAAAAYRGLLALHPDLPSARFNLAWCLQAQGRRAEAIDLFESLSELSPSTTPDLQARANRAVAYLRQVVD